MVADGDGDGSGFQVPLTHDNLTFGARQEARLKEIERKVDEELRKKRRDWNRDVARMREEVIRLLPVDRSTAVGDADNEAVTLEPFIARRRGSTDCLDVRKMKTLFLEYPDCSTQCALKFRDQVDLEYTILVAVSAPARFAYCMKVNPA